ncbi:hypothetical protein CC1G_06828 [Coprinopsis cinerea okayama7|uniref:Uncharacterized protein n=1 Tax=Coprinopsis cinerea (strain Okayama-7 / 130 / ATCC MYA-4618 / FGSC 9003) TaxID=240176 RepID=A8N6V6_COPC7|nr:hypothetical protein CC1G_06828 [Coprinopsis cinerea okayama7\|eukprot:XP_001830562.2 hypothetical protein CC1G_06828 [Coprinopsis cinerea okayama7\
MTHTSPCSYLVWTTLVALVGSFLIFHLWSFDRFKCLRWNNGPHNGAFKRFMTYSYLTTLPLIFVYALGNTIIKYREGFIVHPELGVIPKPHQLWSKASHDTIFPLMLVFSIAWGLEMVTHLEELCFWLFLVNSGSSQQNWFNSHYFKTWIVGSVVAIIYMPLVTIFTRHDALKAEAYTFLAGSLGSLCLTLWFTPILWTFPNFLNNLRREGVDTGTVVRLTKFAELNTIRVIFRFLFTVPLLILGVDGVRPHHHINEKMVFTDLLVVIAGFGCAISSAITLLIFFPRSIEGEIAARDARKEKKRLKSQGAMTVDAAAASQIGTDLKATFGPQSIDETLEDDRARGSISTHDHKKQRLAEEDMDTLPSLRSGNRRRGKDIELGGMGAEATLTESNLSLHNMQYGNISAAVSNFTSPIDFAYASEGFQQQNHSRLTFNRSRNRF